MLIGVYLPNGDLGNICGRRDVRSVCMSLQKISLIRTFAIRNLRKEANNDCAINLALQHFDETVKDGAENTFGIVRERINRFVSLQAKQILNPRFAVSTNQSTKSNQ